MPQGADLDRYALLGQTLPLGKFERLEILKPHGRALAQISHDRMVFVRVTNVTPPA